jgi:hypothetical protein
MQNGKVKHGTPQKYTRFLKVAKNKVANTEALNAKMKWRFGGLTFMITYTESAAKQLL